MLKKTGNDMNLKTLLLIFLFFLSLLPGKGFCFDVTAHVDKLKISIEDSIYLKVVVNGGKADLDLSTIRDFKVISRGSSSSYNYINSQSQRKAIYQYVLIPLKKGTLKIPSIKVVLDGETAFTKQIDIQVSDQVLSPNGAKSLFAIAEVVKPRLFTGEQTVFSFKFFTSKRLSGLGFEKPPGFSGFSSKPFAKEKNYSQNINGVLYHVTQVDYLIIPEKPGVFHIDPIVLIARVVVESKQNSPFDSFFNDSFFSTNSTKPVRVTSNPVKITVDNIPPYQGDVMFSGLVGRFNIESELEPASLKVGESSTLSVKISGVGNIMDASLPQMDLDQGSFKVYDDNPIESISLTQNGYDGSKIFKKAIVPVKPGKFLINPVSLVYFDVDKKEYKQISTPKFSINVSASQEMNLPVIAREGQNGNAAVKQEVLLVNKDILEIKEGIEVLESWQEIHPFLFILLLSIPAILFSGVKLFVMAVKKDLSVEKRMQGKARRHLRTALNMDKDNKDFLGHLYSGLVALIFAKGGKSGENVTIKEARTILTHANMDEIKIDQVTRLLETIESVRFGGGKIDAAQSRKLLKKTKQVMRFISVILICLTFFSVVPQQSMANNSTTFLDAIKHYRQSDFKQAAEGFESIAQNNIKNPYLFYNIANAYLKANDIGHAILWYERAKTLVPNDPDLKFNLDYANTLTKDKKENVTNIMDVLFFWDTMISLKTIQVIAIFLSFCFFTWAIIRLVKKQKILSGPGLVLCTLFILVTAIAWVNYYKKITFQHAVIVKEEVAVRSGVTDTSTKLFSLHAGTKVRVKKIKNKHLKIIFSKGKIGWIKLGEALII